VCDRRTILLLLVTIDTPSLDANLVRTNLAGFCRCLNLVVAIYSGLRLDRFEAMAVYFGDWFFAMRSRQASSSKSFFTLEEILMKSRVFATIALALVVAFVAGESFATTIGFVGARASNNLDILTNYGSNVAADGTGWTVSDGSGATPDVALYWGGGASAGTGWDWEFHQATTFAAVESLHNGGAWDAANPTTTNAVAQLQEDVPAGAVKLQFLPAASVALRLNSFDIGNASDQSNPVEGPYGFNIALIRDSDSLQVWSHQTPLFNGNDAEPVAVNYTGAIGQSYTLTFTRYGSGSGIIFRSGLDNVSFSQVPEPSCLALMALCSLGLLPVARRSR
jgi:hypothetical protein